MSPDEIRGKLLTLFPGNLRGLWKIHGEDPNCDMGGSHSEPDLGTVLGTYARAVDYALEQPAFIVWGGGGRIERLDDRVVDLDSYYSAENLALRRRRADLEKELRAIDDALGNGAKR